jgi:hypothetical protein
MSSNGPASLLSSSSTPTATDASPSVTPSIEPEPIGASATCARVAAQMWAG